MKTVCIVVFFAFVTCVLCGSENPETVRVRKGHSMRSFMKDSVDPCNDFYKYACGNWKKYNRLKQEQYSYGVMDVLNAQVTDFILKAIIFGDTNSSVHSIEATAANETQIIKDYYSLCRLQKSSRIKPYLRALDIPGCWPVINATWNEKEFDWLNLTAQLKILNEPCLFDVFVAPNVWNTTRNAIYLSVAEFPLFPPKAYLENRDSRIEEMLTTIMSEPFSELKMNQSHAESISKSILEFETKLAKIYPQEIDEDVLDFEEIKNVTLDMAQERVPAIDLLRFIKIVSGMTIPGSQQIIMINPSYFDRLVETLNETKPDVLANYFLYRIYYAIQKNSEQDDNACTDEIVNAFGSFFAHLYNLAFHNEEVAKDVEDIAKNIKETFKKLVSQADWLDAQTMEEALAKLDSLSFGIRGLSNLSVYQNVKDEIAALTFSHVSYYENFFKLQAYIARRNFIKFNQLNVKNQSESNTAEVNAYYVATANRVIIPTNILQNLVYNYNFPNSVKYGVLGYIIGHEATHSLDNAGRLFDSQGQVREWWSNTSSQEFSKRVNCLQVQYANLTSLMNTSLTNVQADTLDENIADNGGLQHAFYAYKSWLLQHPEADETLPLINMTNIQLFFLSFAQFFCHTIKPAAVFVTMLTDDHSINEHRVFGTLSNFEEFSNAFQCPLGSKMNPAKRCRIW